MERMVGILAFLVVFVTLASSKPSVPSYIECVDSSDCGKGECCTIGMGRFTIPVCRRMMEVDDQCKADHEPFSTNVVYPDGNAINLTNVFHNFCPCSPHLFCSASSATCVDPADNSDFNYIDENEIYD